MTEINMASRHDPAAQAALFEGIVASASDAIVTADAQFRILSFNPAAQSMFGLTEADVLGTSMERFIPERYRETYRRHIGRYATPGNEPVTSALGALVGVRGTGEEFPVQVSICRVSTNDEPVMGILLREIGRPAVGAEATQLAREVDHRAKNILAMVSSLIALTNADSQKEYVETLTGRVAALSRANSLLSVERWQGAALTALIRGEMEAQPGDAKREIAGPDVQIATRYVQALGMLLHELAANAAHHGALSSNSGIVSVQWTERPEIGLDLSWVETGGPRIGEPPKPGLGLTLASQIVTEQLGGTIALHWKANGLQTDIHLPATILELRRSERVESQVPAAPAADPIARVDPTTVPASQGTLLIVEDEPILALQLSRALGRFGWSVIGVASSLDAANRMLAENPRPDVAILDVDLGGVPVFPFARALRRSDIPFLFCTGYEDVGYNREFADCLVVRKPATALQIVAALRETVHARNVAAG